MGRPAIDTWPRASGIRPASARRTSLVPEPTWPAMAMISPPLARSPKSLTCPGTESWSMTTRPSRGLLSRLSTALLSATLPSMSSTMLCRFISAAGCEAIIRPSRSTVTREHRSNTSPSRCETKMTLLPALASSRTPAKTRSISRSPRVAVGSSRIRMRALALGHGEILHHGVGPHIVEAKSRQQALDLAPIVCARAEIGANAAEQDVLQHRQRRHEAEFLFDDRYADCLRVPGVRQCDRRPVDQDLPLVGRDDAGKRLDERALAGAVMSNQGVNFASLQRQRYAAERDNRPERLGDATRLQRQRSTGH